MTIAVDERPPHSFAIIELFTHGRGVATILLWVMYFMNLLNLYFINNWLPTILNDAGVGIESAIKITALFQFGGVAGSLFLGQVLDRRFSFGVVSVSYLVAAAFVSSSARQAVRFLCSL